MKSKSKFVQYSEHCFKGVAITNCHLKTDFRCKIMRQLALLIYKLKQSSRCYQRIKRNFMRERKKKIPCLIPCIHLHGSTCDLSCHEVLSIL